MGDNDFKKINVGENFMQYKPTKRQNRKNHKNENISQLRPLTVKELLLQKLKQYKKEKSRKNRETSQENTYFKDRDTPALTTNFTNGGRHSQKIKVAQPIMNHNYGSQKDIISNPIDEDNKSSHENFNIYKPNPSEYGNLKYGIKPTYRQLQRNKSVKLRTPKGQTQKKIKVEIEKKFNLGRNITQKKVGVFIKNNESRRKVNDEKVNIQKSNMKTVKNYLKTQNLINYGTHAPNELLREIYSSSKLCGDVYNTNGQSLLHNYMNEE